MSKPHQETVLCEPCGVYHLDHCAELRAEVEALEEARHVWERWAKEMERRNVLLQAEMEEARTTHCPPECWHLAPVMAVVEAAREWCAAGIASEDDGEDERCQDAIHALYKAVDALDSAEVPR